MIETEKVLERGNKEIFYLRMEPTRRNENTLDVLVEEELKWQEKLKKEEPLNSKG